MLLRSQTSTSKHQHQLRRLWLMPLRLKLRLNLMPLPSQPPQVPQPPLMHQPLPQPPPKHQLLLKLPQLSFNFTEVETLPKRDPLNHPNHPNPIPENHNHPTHQAQANER
jgi:hypothetical protein